MKENTYRTHQKILGAILIAYSALNLFGAVTLLTAVNFVTAFVDEPGLAPLVFFLCHLFGIAILVLSVPAIIGGAGMLREAAWSKNISLVVGIIYLIFIPIGTIIGIYCLWFNSQQIIRDKEPIYATDLVKNAR